MVFGLRSFIDQHPTSYGPGSLEQEGCTVGQGGLNYGFPIHRPPEEQQALEAAPRSVEGRKR